MAARRAGMTLGQWLNTIIRDSTDPRVDSVGSQATDSTAPMERAVQRLTELPEKIEALIKDDTETHRRSTFGGEK